MKTRVLVPVMARDHCVGHLLLTAKGWRACGEQDAELGYYQTQASATTAILRASEVTIAEKP